MKVNPQQFFNFCSGHVPLLRRLAEVEGEISEAEARRCIRETAGQTEELPETTWRRLNELQILVPTEPGSDFHLLADPVHRLLRYLFDEARAATPQIVRGYIDSLGISARQVERAVSDDDPALLRLAVGEIQQALLRIRADLEETHRCILGEVARYKTERRSVSVREKFRRIVHWMNQYVDPMVDVVRADGPLRATFDEVERVMRLAREHGLFNDLPALERNLRLLRLVQREALRVFTQCRRELQPLYESLRRSSFIAEGAALALERLQREGLAGWAEVCAVPVLSLRWQHVAGDTAIDRALSNVHRNPPPPPPILALDNEDPAPADFTRRLWLESLPENIRPGLPVDDLLAWLVEAHPARGTADTLAGFTRLIFDPALTPGFEGGPVRSYRTADGELEAQPVRLCESSP